ncbi:NAD(P)(+)--arginine ADP-ribosyltransferase 2-like [Acipenser ruthenus]|uniref:NAD(P)(+)--arginine ADP-ribosyltransferase 2-like n=1 Tax=Acipenser ruthenus TaxID=7906 RepID=UPI002741EC0C|nr:NAD(P)(+)--arginine ADP-ribosyltransferase 2-like [Acipenser ruthenus]
MNPAALSILLLSAAALLELPQMKCDSSIPMDLAEDALDDQYQGCRETMLKNINTTHLPSELNKNPALKKAWKIAQRETKRQRHKELSLEQATAIYVYTMDDVYSAFNAAIRTGGTRYSEFPFKALHFHLTDALKALRPNKNTCYDVFRGVKVKFKTAEDKTVRFGQFASASLNQSVAEGFGNATLFAIRTCLGVPIKKYSEKPQQEEVLIPPFEAFKVMKVNGNEIRLEHIADQRSNFNCLECVTVFKPQCAFNKYSYSCN